LGKFGQLLGVLVPVRVSDCIPWMLIYPALTALLLPHPHRHTHHTPPHTHTHIEASEREGERFFCCCWCDFMYFHDAPFRLRHYPGEATQRFPCIQIAKLFNQRQRPSSVEGEKSWRRTMRRTMRKTRRKSRV